MNDFRVVVDEVEEMEEEITAEMGTLDSISEKSVMMEII